MSANLRSQLQAIRDERGSLTPALVVEVAADPAHPLHSRFEWDDAIAGHKYRLEQAGQLLRVTFTPDPSKPRDLRAFVTVKGEDSPTSEYVPTDEAMADPFTQQLVLRAMKRDAETFKKRWQHMAEYASVVRTLMQGEAS